MAVRLSLAAAWLLLGLSRALTLALPFSAIRRLLGDHRSPAAGQAAPGQPARGPQDVARARQVGWLVRSAAARTPWLSECYPQALTARFLLRLVGVPHSVTFGMRRDDAGELRAHVWVTAAEVAVTGGAGQAWVGVGSFDWAPRRH